MAIYLVESPQGKTLVDAKTKSSAINHVMKNIVTAAAVSATDVVKLMGDGVKVEAANPEEPAA